MTVKVVFIHQTRHGVPYADACAAGHKTIETRSRNMLSALVGERVLIARTTSGKAPEIIGAVDIVSANFCAAADFGKYFDQHCVPPGSKYDCHGKGKWFYHLSNAEPCKPYPLPANAIRHGRSWCEIEI